MFPPHETFMVSKKFLFYDIFMNKMVSLLLNLPNNFNLVKIIIIRINDNFSLVKIIITRIME